jgi:hypothetical protein
MTDEATNNLGAQTDPASELEDGDALAKKTFVITVVGAVLFIGTTLIFVLL